MGEWVGTTVPGIRCGGTVVVIGGRERGVVRERERQREKDVFFLRLHESSKEGHQEEAGGF